MPPELLGRYHLHEYVKFLGIPFLGLVAADVFVKVVNQPFFTAWVVLALFFGVILWRVRQADFSDKEATAALVIGGLLAGLTHAIMRLVAAPDFSLFFNVIAEPLLAAGLGGTVGWTSAIARPPSHQRLILLGARCKGVLSDMELTPMTGSDPDVGQTKPRRRCHIYGYFVSSFYFSNATQSSHTSTRSRVCCFLRLRLSSVLRFSFLSSTSFGWRLSPFQRSEFSAASMDK